MQIFVRTPAVRTVTLGVAAADTIAAVELQVQHIQRIPPDEQCLIRTGKQLAGSRTLEDCKIQSQGTLFLALRLRGGSQKKTPHSGDAVGFGARCIACLSLQRKVKPPFCPAYCRSPAPAPCGCRECLPQGRRAAALSLAEAALDLDAWASPAPLSTAVAASACAALAASQAEDAGPEALRPASSGSATTAPTRPRRPRRAG